MSCANNRQLEELFTRFTKHQVATFAGFGTAQMAHAEVKDGKLLLHAFRGRMPVVMPTRRTLMWNDDGERATLQVKVEVRELADYSDLCRFVKAVGELLLEPLRRQLALEFYTDDERRVLSVGVGSSPGVGCDHVVVIVPDVPGMDVRQPYPMVVECKGVCLSAEVRQMRIFVPRKKGE